MKFLTFVFAIAVAAVLACLTARAAEMLPDDQVVTINGVKLACTGVGDEAQSDPRWQAFPVRLEFAGSGAEYLADLDVTLADAAGKELVAVRCNSPWLLAELSPGQYRVDARFENQKETARFKAPAKGQARVVVRFAGTAGN